MKTCLHGYIKSIMHNIFNVYKRYQDKETYTYICKCQRNKT